MEAENGEARLVSKGRSGLMRIETQKKLAVVCHDDSTSPVKAQTIDELHCLQKKKSALNTPRTARTPGQGQELLLLPSSPKRISRNSNSNSSGFDDFAGFVKMVILRFLVFRF
ncbi:hypothetical protein SO802_003626 [Lithocarpus litseifolius]|uniref:Uncharacterized protein n=1 Tax=Lithocarpus litseifolius TaxID=425828 RepID=A0AAW2E170_9ROSI